MMQMIFWIVVAIIGIGFTLLGNRLVKNAPKNEEHTMCYVCPYEDKDNDACPRVTWCENNKREDK